MRSVVSAHRWRSEWQVHGGAEVCERPESRDRYCRVLSAMPPSLVLFRGSGLLNSGYWKPSSLLHYPDPHVSSSRWLSPPSIESHTQSSLRALHGSCTAAYVRGLEHDSDIGPPGLAGCAGKVEFSWELGWLGGWWCGVGWGHAELDSRVRSWMRAFG